MNQKVLMAFGVLILASIAYAQTNPFVSQGAAATVTAIHVADVTPGATCDPSQFSAVPRAMWIGGAGDLDIQTYSGEAVTITGVPAGTLLPIAPRCVLNTSTATSIQVWW